MAKVVPQQKPGRSQQDYSTPECFLLPVQRYLGLSQGFAYDFAADLDNSVAEYFCDQATNALALPHWEDHIVGGWGWLNPPFADIAPWAKRCAETGQSGGHLAFLVPASVGSNWFRDYVHGQALVLFLNGRIPFIPEQPSWGYPKDLVLALYGPAFDPGYAVWDWRRG